MRAGKPHSLNSRGKCAQAGERNRLRRARVQPPVTWHGRCIAGSGRGPRGGLRPTPPRRYLRVPRLLGCAASQAATLAMSWSDSCAAKAPMMGFLRTLAVAGLPVAPRL